ncbi:hypothetical protein SDRG_01631 [Saprolegnia diclina VS20]|uniref:Secreted protein n=1 Tax=Saprolegnia diclina (strain VS20) TaxID=1156394 RepID=T0S8Q4_SAPDV|nr:hypothetical protein SDRG_01631 [Saprolegnia diclina VS20]EQC41673.1 hypothetical protein SDRG_01631 [Saprolegnia diclina VS20]|eukprot:XP_008605387.1 hypothetical protein SDRG_01631 [Saprolegnia diclina VS20]
MTLLGATMTLLDATMTLLGATMTLLDATMTPLDVTTTPLDVTTTSLGAAPSAWIEGTCGTVAAATGEPQATGRHRVATLFCMTN